MTLTDEDARRIAAAVVEQLEERREERRVEQAKERAHPPWITCSPADEGRTYDGLTYRECPRCKEQP